MLDIDIEPRSGVQQSAAEHLPEDVPEDVMCDRVEFQFLAHR